MLSGYVNSLGDNWDKYLSLCTFAYNNSVQQSTKFTPYFLNYLRHPILPLDLELETRIRTCYNPDSINGNAKIIKHIWDLVRDNLIKAQARQKETADDLNKAKEHEFMECELILIKNERKSNKFDKLWLGPYEIVAIKKPNLIIKSLEGKTKEFTIHMDKAKKYRTPHTLPLRKKDLITEDIGEDKEIELGEGVILI
jgi:hypothetical protein